ncbi:MAG TPA: hypothetical protein VLR91_08660 [Thermodesulfobacteriota bacterium]|nr:hypothetical protein [Thermodesulfobacteriota bacterium]
MIVGGFLGWSLAPRSYYPGPDYYPSPPYYDASPEYGYPPPGEGAQPPPAEGQLFIYPRQGQNQDQQAKDHYECHNQSVDQTGFDPTLPPPAGTPEAETAQNSANYLRALEACLDARGYTLR